MSLTEGMYTSNTDQWATPIELFNILDKEFNFEVDVCAGEDNHKCPVYYSKEDNGLIQDWGRRRCFMNPPYGREIGKWTKKAVESAKKGAIVVGLLPNRTDTAWYEDVMKAYEIRLIKGRLHFNDGINPAPFPSIIAVWRSGRLMPYPKLTYQNMEANE